MNPTTGDDNQHLVRGLRGFDSISRMLRSEFYRDHRTELRALLNEPRIYEFEGAAPRLKSFLRVVQWNIEYGIRLDGIVDALTNHPLLRFADVILLNEVDDGMLRSGNANVARELGERLRAHVIYGVEYLELGTSGPGQGEGPGENTVALHGNAILTRHPFRDPQIIRLPRCENNFASAQKRLGGRLGLILDIEPAAGDRMTVAAVHLDVVNRPPCRRNQIHALLEAIEARLSGGKRRALVAGDLNTHTFVRGGRIRAFRNLVRVLAADQQRLAAELLHPEDQEPALGELTRSGYDLDGFNDRLPTQRMGGGALGDASGLPDVVRRLALKRLGPAGLMLQFRLDWIAARGLSPLGAGECADEPTGEASAPPKTITGLTHEGRPLSDHDPIVADIPFTSPFCPAVAGRRE
ncbi:MAG TPA: endonuclease/exonuclease/phosphatase family protein [Blastocatellia bacterium]|nr:endonuclease/exonuclease/phosphatase family protein [Blastocatellia bacterium]